MPICGLYFFYFLFSFQLRLFLSLAWSLLVPIEQPLGEKADWLDLIERYNFNLDQELKIAGFSRESFKNMIDLDNQGLVFLHNFYRGAIYGENNFFVVKINSYPTKDSSPRIGRIIRKISMNRALVEVFTVAGELKRTEVKVSSNFKFEYF